ncbi:MAG TPA: hypothetical protein VE870_11080 [Bacteroidales bacterium]|nr:hypothetical protein [Bacteroidales bacterium]
MKTTRPVLIIVAVIVILPFLGRFFWLLQKGKKMEIMIINKTVPRNSHNEVKALNWVLNYNKILKTDNTRYRFEKDYYGYHPDAPAEEWKIRAFRMADLPSLQEKYSAVIFLDNQGVSLTRQAKEIAPKYYGGFNQNDYFLLMNMLNAGKLIVAEYNFFSDPTEALVRYNTEQMLDIHCLGWRGKRFSDLSAAKIRKEINPDWIDHYKEYYGEIWDFRGPGLILLNERQNRIIVLPHDEFMDRDYPDVVTDEKYAHTLNVPDKTAFGGWFAIVYHGENEVISTFDLNLNDKGKEIMMKNGLNCNFPAVIKSVNHPFYYVAGDFSKENVHMVWSRVKIINTVLRAVESRMTDKPGLFFQTYYVPFMSAVLEEHYEEMNEAGV